MGAVRRLKYRLGWIRETETAVTARSLTGRATYFVKMRNMCGTIH